MKTQIIANHYAVASGRYMADALKRLGHEVKTTGEAHGAAIWGIEVDPQYIWEPDPPGKDWTPDLVIYADAHVEFKRVADCPHVVYGVDNHVRDYAQFRKADHLFLAHGHGYRIGEANVSWLPCGYDPAVFTPGPPWKQRATDAALLGVLYGNRAELIYAVAGITGVKMAYGLGAVHDQYADIYQNAKVSLVMSAARDVAQRVWETAAMGCLVVMDECPDAGLLGLVDGVNCLMYRTTAQAAEAVRWSLDVPESAEKIAKAGQKWARPGTWDARLQVILDWVNAAQEPQKAVLADETRD